VFSPKSAQEENYGNNVSFSDNVEILLCAPKSFLNYVAKFFVVPQFSKYYPGYATWTWNVLDEKPTEISTFLKLRNVFSQEFVSTIACLVKIFGVGRNFINEALLLNRFSYAFKDRPN
jgi:hypothetical protein